jgi:ribose transport system ATP-binding protein
MPSLLCVSKLTKSFPGVLALAEVSLSVATNEFVAVIGENGAGKSTLMKMLGGIHQPDLGTIEFEGKPVVLDSVLKAQALGIALIHQELNLADNLDVSANVFLGREPQRFGFIDKQRMREETQLLLDRLNAGFTADVLVESLSLGQRQLVEIAKALSLQAKLLIMDEPTSSLSARESESLFAVIAQLRQQGISILYISHRLGEVMTMADRVVALRDGRNAGELTKDQISHEAMIRLMIGRDMTKAFDHHPQKLGGIALEVCRLKTQANPSHELNFSVRRGEIVGIAGLVGSGRTEVLRALFGVEPPLAGELRVNDTAFIPKHPADAVKAGLALVPEDRKALGVFLPESVKWNISLPNLWQNQHGAGFLNTLNEDEMAISMTQKLKIKAASISTLVGTLSGGNQQKVALAKWLAMKPKLLLLDEPTRGIDVGAKREIYQLMEELACEGMAILFVSSEMEEVLAMSYRVLVMHEGRLAGELHSHELSEEAVMRLASGQI